MSEGAKDQEVEEADAIVNEEGTTLDNPGRDDIEKVGGNSIKANSIP